MEYNCCFCEEKHSGYGNNPSPIMKKGRCCDTCNIRFVITIRMVHSKYFEECENGDDDTKVSKVSKVSSN